jgi:hypothetical protein
MLLLTSKCSEGGEGRVISTVCTGDATLVGWEEAERLKPKTFQGHNDEKINRPSNRIRILDVGSFRSLTWAVCCVIPAGTGFWDTA